MKVLVTGGAGFIGSHLCDLLISQGHIVKVVDNLNGGRKENLNNIFDHANFEFVEADICDKSAIESEFHNMDWVIHLAGIADIVPSIEQPEQYYATNVSGTLNVLECSRKNNIKRFVYAASSSCYGVPEQYPTTESEVTNPQYPYALTKLLGEQLVLHWGKVYKLPVLSLRLFNIYGPRVRTNGAYGAVFGVFLAQKANNQSMTVVGDGKQTRDFTFVTDVAAAFYAAAQSSYQDEVMNVGSGFHYSINYLADLLGGEITYIAKRPGEPSCTFADTSKITKLLHWKPQVSFEDGVNIMLDEIERWNNAPLWNPKSIEQATKSWFEYLEGGKDVSQHDSRYTVSGV